MMSLVRNPKDFWMGVLYLGVGGVGLFYGRDYAVGSAANMGPGFFPFYISCLLLVFAAISFGRSALTPGDAVGPIAWKATALVTCGIVLFGFLIELAGLLITMPLLLGIGALASDKFHLDWRAAFGVLAFTLFCAALFTYGLGLPIPLLGSWFR